MNLTPKSKPVTDYYKTLESYEHQGVTHEMAVRHAFAKLLEAAAKPLGWTLVLEHPLRNRKKIDGALLDDFNLPRGYWEAKDTHDDLEAEIVKKTGLGYPLKNTIFEDTQTGILYQNDQRVMVADLTKPADLLALLTQFLSHTEEQIEEFHDAVREFQERIPELAEKLVERIEEEYQENQAFADALGNFFTLCQDSLNPNISMEAIKEMLVQHLLTERLFRTIFNNPDFTRRNVIAAEIETVIDALTRRSFSRHDFLRQLDYFYVAIERAAATIHDFSEKQAFLNTVYEQFFQSFSRKQADTHGIVYTPQEIVDFMCASVDEVLQQEFGLSLSHEQVCILDPCVGTGNFMVNIINRLSRRTLRHKYEHELFCNEVMLLPYYIASLNIEHAYLEQSGSYHPFPGICFADTLDLAKERQLSFLTPANTERVERERQAEITVIIGNPPYNVGQINENDNNKNRLYDEIDRRVRETYAQDSRATNRNALSDPYVKFFRWATDRLEGRDGVVCFVTNNSFVNQFAFDGMRKHLLQDFTAIYHIDLHGNVRQNPKLSGTTHNVFGIQVGVGITLLVRKAGTDNRGLRYHRVPEDWRKEEKLMFLSQRETVGSVEWETLQPDAKHTWLTQGMHAEFDTFLPIGTVVSKAAKRMDVETIFKSYSIGVQTGRDNWTYSFNQNSLSQHVQTLGETYNAELSRWKRAGKPGDIDNFVLTDETRIKWSSRLKECFKREIEITFDRGKIRNALYRPFTRQYLYFDSIMTHRQGVFPFIFPTPETEAENIVIWLKVGSEWPMFALVSNVIPDLLPQGGSQCFPYYTYDEDGDNRRENITDWALGQFRAHYGEQVSRRDIFAYVYALLHHPTYRERYAENLKRDLPRIPLVGDSAAFAVLVGAGQRLIDLHLNYETAKEYPALVWVENEDIPFSWAVDKMKLSKDKTAVVVNDSLTLERIPPEVFDYRLGNRSALEWVIDQYRVKTDRRSGIRSDPNRPDEPEYIARLVARVVTVSVETVALVREIAAVEMAGAGAGTITAPSLSYTPS